MSVATGHDVEALSRKVPGYDPWETSGDCTFDVARAEQVLDFCRECLKFTEGKRATKPVELEPWQSAILVNLYGWIRPDGSRRYREAFVFVPRKNGKTVLGAVLILTEMFLQNEPGAQLYSAAAEREQAGLAFRHAAAMIRQEPELEARCEIKPSLKVIERSDGEWAMYKALSADANTKHGLSPSFCLIDELHAHPNRNLTDVLLTGTGARTDPLVVYITTADYDHPSICNEKYDYAVKVRDGLANDPAFLPVIFEASADDDWTDPKTWYKANPNLGVSKQLDYIERECKKAQAIPAYTNTFLRLDLNVRTQQDVRAIPMDQWDLCGGGVAKDDAQAQLAWREHMLSVLAKRRCAGGLDLGAVSDLTAFVLLFPDEDGAYDLLPFFWCSEMRAQQRERRDRVPYLAWGRTGFVKLTEGNETDYQVVRRDINDLCNRFGCFGITADRLFQGAQLCQDLIRDGLNVSAHGQGYLSMAAPTRRFLELVSEGKLRHGMNPVLRWQAGNASTESDTKSGETVLKFSRKKSTEKIDGIMATCMSLSLAMANEDQTATCTLGIHVPYPSSPIGIHAGDDDDDW